MRRALGWVSSILWSFTRGWMRRGMLRPGADAPDFRIKQARGGGFVALSDFRGKTPVALVFGSFT
jgi:hypothetical protein